MAAAMRSALLTDLDRRGLVADATSLEELDGHLASPAAARRSIYVGFDPTADSLHVGSLLPLLALRRVQLAGHRPIVLIGGGTGLIGDPSGKTGERQLNPAEQVEAWARRLADQVRPFLDFEAGATAALLVNNYEWLAKLDVISFLRDVGKHFGVGAMIARESVRGRMGRAGGGISYTEFSYQLLQAYDFVELHRRHGCTVQFGGTDQWGNITAGTDLIRRYTGQPAYGLTLPLVTRTDGSKFGKTESGTIWLDPARTSAYEMYQFWLNTADADVVRYLRYFTFLAPDEIDRLGRRTANAPQAREAQRVLAREATRLVHGPAGLAAAERETAQLFGAGEADGAAPEGTVIVSPEPRPLWSVLKETGLVASTSEARRLISQGGVEVDRSRVADLNFRLAPGRGYLIQVGKRRRLRVTLTPR
jgi:tyrosyl-tRNA synthetase